MNQVHVLVDYDYGVEVIGVFTDKTLLEEYVACTCETESECHDVWFWTVPLDDPTFKQPSKNGRETTNMNEIHVLSNGLGEVIGAFTDKSVPQEYAASNLLVHKCRYCRYSESGGHVCVYRQSFIDIVALDDPSLIQHFKESIAQVRAQIRDSKKPVEQGLG